MKFKKVSFVIPALNEEKSIGKTLKEIPVRELEKSGLETEVVVVDSDSGDRTAEIAKSLGARVVNEPLRGYGRANLKGFKEARGDIIIKADADGTYPVKDALKLLRPILEGKADVVVGNRFAGGLESNAMTLTNMVGNKLITLNSNLLYGIGVGDTQCGFRAFTRKAFEKMDLKCTGMEFASEFLIEAAQKKLKILEVPIVYRKRVGGAPKLNPLRDGYRHFSYIWKRFLAREN